MRLKLRTEQFLDVDKIFYVYVHISDKGVPFYVGCASRKPEHVKIHKVSRGDRFKFKRAYRNPFARSDRSSWSRHAKFMNYNVIIDGEFFDHSEALEREKELIKLYGREYDRTGTLLNLTIGGKGIVYI